MFSVLTLSARADCSRVGPTWGNVVASFPASIAIPLNAAVGSVVASVTVPIPNATAGVVYANCSPSGNIYWAIRGGTNVPNRKGNTSIQGIGYSATLTGGGFPGNMAIDFVYDSSTLPGGPASPQFTAALSATVNLVVTSNPIGSGPLAINPSGSYGKLDTVGSLFVGNGGDGAILFNITVPPNAATVATSGCALTTSSVAVSLPKALSSALTSVGATTGSTPFSISLNCPAGVNVNVTLTDANNPSNRTATLGLGSDSSASGVGLQILHDGTLVTYGTDTSAAGNAGQWSAGVSTGGAKNIALTAQYIRTGTTLVPGTVNAKATFTMSYQ